nr:hypothetical protein [uncultured Roseococcus sp.]
MNIKFLDRGADVVAALAAAFAGRAGVAAEVGTLADATDFDVLITPGNSFGLMDGGFDQAVLDRYGMGAQYAVTEAIAGQSGGILPIGSALVVSLAPGVTLAGDDRVREYTTPGVRLVYAPTMLTPRTINGTINVYLAFAAALRAIQRDIPDARNVLCPGLGTAVGRLHPQSAAAQMALAHTHWRDGFSAEGWPAVNQCLHGFQGIVA